MRKRVWNFFSVLVLVAALFMQPKAAPVEAQALKPTGNQFVKQAGPELRLNGKIFRFAGSNNYYLMYKSQFMVDDVLDRAAAQGFRVLRIWGSLEIGNQDGSNSVDGIKEGVYFQYWDGDSPAYNDGPDGLQRLDYIVHKAGQNGIKLVIPFVNNWNAFGGMDQYVRWAGGQYHDDFYTNPVIRQWYKDWIAHLLNRTNIYTGIRYKDDPTIMTWELANEPRCLSAGAYPRSPNCTTDTLIEWADDVSTFIKTIDPKHLVSVGDEGFHCIPGAADWTENCSEGVDTLAFTALDNIDVMSFHLYPDHWGKSPEWGTAWIERHFADARALGKPAMLGEFGLQDKSIRNPVFKTWTDAVFQSRGAGALYWILSGEQDGGTLYPDYDGFTVYCPSPVCTTMANFGRMMAANRWMEFPPVADDDSAVTPFAAAVSIPILANDITYGGAALDPATIDLDPAAPGIQTTLYVYGGTFALQPDASVLFTPDAGFSGRAQGSYQVADSRGRISNTAVLYITVMPDPAGVQVLFSFETGTEGWGPASWEGNAGSVAQSTEHATDGARSLQIAAAGGGWFGLVFPQPVDMHGKTRLKYDVSTTGAGTSTNVAVQFGSGWTWCEGSWGWVNAGSTATVEVDLTNMTCGAPQLDDAKAMYIYFSGGGTYYLDHIRIE